MSDTKSKATGFPPVEGTKDNKETREQRKARLREAAEAKHAAKEQEQAKVAAKPKPEPKVPETPEQRDARIAAKKTNPCVCGCGQLVERFFAQGHDARVHGWLLKVAKGALKLAELNESVRKALDAGIVVVPDVGDGKSKTNGKVLNVRD